MLITPRCDDEDETDDYGCPPCERGQTRMRDWAMLIGAVAPVLVAVIKYVPATVAFFQEQLREPPAPGETIELEVEPEPPPPARKPRKRAGK